jgi:hypothetical protein
MREFHMGQGTVAAVVVDGLPLRSLGISQLLHNYLERVEIRFRLQNDMADMIDRFFLQAEAEAEA